MSEKTVTKTEYRLVAGFRTKDKTTAIKTAPMDNVKQAGQVRLAVTRTMENAGARRIWAKVETRTTVTTVTTTEWFTYVPKGSTL